MNWALAVTADGCLLSLVSSAEEGVKDVLSGLEILDLFICIADISLPEGEDIGVVDGTFIYYLFG